jgi:virulence-associated protein VapD
MGELSKKEEKRFMAAMTKRLHWYEKCMENIKNKTRTKIMMCNICRSLMLSSSGQYVCHKCPISPCTNRYRRGAMKIICHCSGNIDYPESVRDKFIKKIKKHYDNLIRKIEKRGFTYK